MQEHGSPSAGGGKQVAAASQTSTGIGLLLALFISSSSRVVPLAGAAGSCQEQCQEGWCTPWQMFCCTARRSHEWLLSGFLPLEASGASSLAARLLSGGRQGPPGLINLLCLPLN